MDNKILRKRLEKELIEENAFWSYDKSSIDLIYIFNNAKGQFYENYSDSPAIIRQDGGRIFLYGKSIQDPVMKDFGTFLSEKSKFGINAISGRIGEVLENLFNLENWQETNSEPLIQKFYFPDREVALAREKNNNSGFYFAAKGGSNGESHNHNDVGSCILFYNGNPVFIDVWVGTYTAKTFSSERYTIWTMQSNYHNLPVINGYSQSPGGRFKAQNSKYTSTKSKVTFSTDISSAYPSESSAQKWTRTYTLERGKKFTINDQYLLKEYKEITSLHYMTPLKSRIFKPGIQELNGDEFVLYVKYNPLILNAVIESIKIDDKYLQSVWGNQISMIVLNINNQNLSGNISIYITNGI